MAGKTSDWRPGPTVCRCCLTEGCYKDISTEYFWMGKREVYAEMLSDTFNVSISYAQTGGRLICEPCIARLRDASDFKRQVQDCEKTFMIHLDPSTSKSGSVHIEVESVDDVKMERVKVEKDESDDDDFPGPDFGDDDDDDDLDDEPLQKYATAKVKVPKKEAVEILDMLDTSQITVKRKSSSKTKEPPKKIKKKEVVVKPTTSKAKAAAAAAEKKKKGTEEAKEKRRRAKLREERNAKWTRTAYLLEYTTICPFKYKKNVFVCLYCDTSFYELRELREHNAVHKDLSHTRISNAVVTGCRIGDGFVKAEVTDIHCKICNVSSDSLTDIKQHLVRNHNKKINIEDDIIPFKLFEDKFICGVCDVVFQAYKPLTTHMNVHFTKHVCDVCGEGFMNEIRLKVHHVRVHQERKDLGSFPCEECGKVFSTVYLKTDHVRRVHDKEKRYQCPHCTECFMYHVTRLRHLESAHGLIREYKCDYCPKVFNYFAKRTNHVNAVHLNIKRFTCDVCELKFYSKSKLNRHMVTHNPELRIQCPVCKKSYARSYVLKQHMKTHENNQN